MKKVMSLIVVIMMIASMSVHAFASEIMPDTYFNNYVDDFRTYISNAQLRRSVADPAELVQAFLAENGANYDAKILIESTETETIDLGDGNSITLDGILIYANGYNDVAATPERIQNGAIDVSDSTRAVSQTTSIRAYYHAVYALVLGQELYRITQEAQFTYNGTSVSVNYADGYYQRGFLSIWQVSDFQDSTESTIVVDGVTYKQVKSSANFHYGLEIDGIGLVIQDNYCWVSARCTKSGTVVGYMDGNHSI